MEKPVEVRQRAPAGSVMGQGIANVAQGETGELTPFQADKSTAGAFVQGFAEGGAPMGQMGPATIDWMQQHGWSPTQQNLNLINATSGYIANTLGYTCGELLNVMSKVFSGGLAGFHQGLTNVLTGAGMEPQSASDFSREVTGYFEIEGSRGGGHPELVPRVEVPDWAKPTPPARVSKPARPGAGETAPADSGLGAIGLARPGEVPPAAETPDQARLRRAFADKNQREEEEAAQIRRDTQGMTSVLPPSLTPAPKVPGPPRPGPEITASAQGDGGIPRRVIGDDTAVTSTGREVPVQYAGGRSEPFGPVAEPWTV